MGKENRFGNKHRNVVIVAKVLFILLWFFFMWDGIRWVLD